MRSLIEPPRHRTTIVADLAMAAILARQQGNMPEFYRLYALLFRAISQLLKTDVANSVERR